MKDLHIVIFLLFVSIIFLGISYRTRMQELQQQIDSLYYYIINVSQENENLKRENDFLKDQLFNLQTSLTSIQNELTNLQDRMSREHVTYPSYSEVLKFIEEDDTDRQEYIEENYTFICTDFTDRFISNFLKKGFFSCEAIIYLPNNSSHSIVAINTTDKGLLFVDPQNDKVIFSLREGDNYCSYIGEDCNWTILKVKHCFVS